VGREPGPLAPPASAENIDKVEALLGFPLPGDLKQLYREVANGGFGPSGGHASPIEATERYRDLLANPPGERGRKSPKNLLPINLSEPGADCYDRTSGEIIYWDEESLADGPSDLVWKRSFKTEAKSLGEWLENWLAKPSAAEASKSLADEGALVHLRQAIPHLRGKTSEERAALGITGEDWEDAMCRQLGVDPADL
jgi:hypothetical protein